MAEATLDYQRMVHEALRDVVRQALTQVAAEGLPGDHHFLLSFHTGAEGVVVPSFLLDLHPDEMSVVLQNQFWDLEVDRDAFSVTLTFGGRRQRLVIPFASVTAFADPSVPFGLRFEAPGGEQPAAGDDRAAGPADDETADQGERPDEPREPGGGGAGSVVHLDRFRKKK